MRSHSAVVSSGTDENDTLKGTLAAAAANPRPAGVVYTGLAPRTKSAGTSPASIAATTSLSTAGAAMPSHAPYDSAGFTVTPTLPNVLLRVATSVALSSARGPEPPAMKSDGLVAATSFFSDSSVFCGTSVALAASDGVSLPASICAMKPAVPGFGAIHKSALRPVSGRRGPMY